MGPLSLISALTNLIPTQLPTLLSGPPGIGKSQIVAQVVKALGLSFIDVRAVLLDPVDLRGVPHIKDDKTQWCSPDFLPSSGRGVIFLDELPQATTLVQASLLQLTLDRRIGDYVLPDGWSIIAAGNRQEDRAGANRLITPLLNRFIHLDLEVSAEDWQAWALTSGVIKNEVRSFIRWKPALLHSFDPKSNEKAFPTPRSWEFVSKVFDKLTGDDQLQAVVAGCVGSGPAAEFYGYLKYCRQLPDIDTVLAKPDTTSVPSEPAVIYALVGALADRAKKADDKVISAIGTYGGRLPAEFATLLVRDCTVVNTKTLQNSVIKDWVKKHKDFIAPQS